MEEFELIKQFFKSSTAQRDDVILGIGDDCALLSPPKGKQLAMSTDTLVSGIHFPEMTSAYNIGYKSLAVNLSDLAAMGAQPAWVSLAVTLPDADVLWLDEFMQGFSLLANKYNLTLIGGDTTKGPLSITVSIIGFVDAGSSLKRSNARSGDCVYVTGNVGDARMGLECYLKRVKMDKLKMDYFKNALDLPEPQIEAGLILSNYNRIAAIDLSDGLLADLQHVCNASNTGASLSLDYIPLSNELSEIYNHNIDWSHVLNAGDDYQICFTCPPNDAMNIEQDFKRVNIKITQIGEITLTNSIHCFLHETEVKTDHFTAYMHFSNEK